jgi:DNA-directed RNA polymerase specialized sigma24 family protein
MDDSGMIPDETGQTVARSEGATGSCMSERFVRLFVANQRRIHGFIRTLVFESADADDILQETSITGLSKFPVFAECQKDFSAERVTEEFVTWICTIARYETLKHCRANKKGIVQFDEALFDALAERQTQ